MTNITPIFDDIYLPVKALLFYERNNGEGGDMFVESYDINEQGQPVNAHPLDIQESAALAECLDCNEELHRNFLTPKGLLPGNVLHIQVVTGSVIWHTKEQEVHLSFTDSLTIPSGKAKIPALLWKADREQLYVYALIGHRKITVKTPLYHAPFFNIHANGLVCMGTVAVSIDRNCCLEEFISRWQEYFFNSYFSHLIEGHVPTKGNIVQLWQGQVNTGREFPYDELKRHSGTIQHLLQ